MLKSATKVFFWRQKSFQRMSFNKFFWQISFILIVAYDESYRIKAFQSARAVDKQFDQNRCCQPFQDFDYCLLQAL